MKRRGLRYYNWGMKCQGNGAETHSIRPQAERMIRVADTG